MWARQIIERAAEKAGIRLGKDMIINDNDLYADIAVRGSLALGEGYTERKWEEGLMGTDDIVCRLTSADSKSQLSTAYNMFAYLRSLAWWVFPPSSKRVADHYNFDNMFFETLLGPTMTYSCGYFTGENTSDLDEAQKAKCALIYKKIGGWNKRNILDIGCGWGYLANYISQNGNTKVTGITIASEQHEYAVSHYGNVDFMLCDYREVKGKYDAIVSVGMFEHVCLPNYRTFMEKAYELLEDGGVFLLHTIGSNKSVHLSDPWINRYIFPNSHLPSLKQIAEASEGLFIIEDVQNLAGCDKTLMCWNENLAGCDIESKYVRRMFKYYLLSCAGSFRARGMQLYQVVLVKNPGHIKYTRPVLE